MRYRPHRPASHERPEAPYVSVVIPIRDEAENVEPLCRELGLVLDKIDEAAEVVVVDDGSLDDGRERVLRMATLDPRVRLVALDGGHGQSAALDAGFRAARGDVIVTLDGDLQNDPGDIPRLLGELRRADVVQGVRVERCDPLVRRIASRVANGVRNWLTSESIRDVGCSMRAMRAEYVRRVRLFRGAHRFLPTLLRMEGARIVEVPVAHRPRAHGRSKYGIGGRLRVGLVDVLGVRWLRSRAFRHRAWSAESPSERDSPGRETPESAA